MGERSRLEAEQHPFVAVFTVTLRGFFYSSYTLTPLLITHWRLSTVLRRADNSLNKFTVNARYYLGMTRILILLASLGLAGVRYKRVLNCLYP